MNYDRWFRSNASEFNGVLAFGEPLSRHTYYRIGGPASVFASPKSLEDLRWLARGLRETGIPFFIMGAGSNLLVSDSGFPGLVIRANRLNLAIDPIQDGSGAAVIRTGASVSVSTLLKKASQEGWGGLEFLTGIPGYVGGAVFMNAGTHLGEARKALRKVFVFPLIGDADGELLEFGSSQLQFEYRKNLFLPRGGLVWAADWEVLREEPEVVKTRIQDLLTRRKSTQPIDYPSCGSVFKNPRASGGQGPSAWQVVDQLGLRGHRIGDAQFSEKHSNFIINLGAAKATDVRSLIALAKSRALAELGIELEEEVIYLE